MKNFLFILLALFSLNSNAQFFDPQCWTYYGQGRATNSQSVYYAVYERIEQDIFSDIEVGQLSYIHRDSLYHKQSQVLYLQDSLNLKLNKTSIASWAKQPNKPSYNWFEIEDRPTIPSNQTLSISGNNLSISGGNSVTLPSTEIIISYPARTVNTNFNVLKTMLVAYSVKIENGTALVSATNASAFLEFSVNGGSTWITVSQVARSENGLSLISLTTKSSTFVLSGIIPGGSIARIRTVVATGSTVNLLSTQENEF